MKYEMPYVDSCRTCKHWQGNPSGKYGRCQRVLFEIANLDGVEDRFGNKIKPPFDPHDGRYYLSSSKIHTIMKDLVRMKYELPAQVMCMVIKEEVLDMDDQQNEIVKTKKIPYLTTHYGGGCKQYEESDTKGCVGSRGTAIRKFRGLLSDGIDRPDETDSTTEKI